MLSLNKKIEDLFAWQEVTHLLESQPHASPSSTIQSSSSAKKLCMLGGLHLIDM
jgi:hypothetical protein